MANINKQLEEITGALALKIDKQIYPESPWLHLVKKKQWPEEIGHVFETVKFRRTLPDADQTWQAHQTADGTGNICNPPTTKLAFKQVRNPVQLESTAIETEDFCVDDMRAKWKRKEQVGLAVDMLSMNIKNTWIDYFRDNYAKVAGKKIVLNATLDETDETDGDNFALSPATSILTNKYLERVYAYLCRTGATRFATSMANGKPIFSLICSMETSRSLINDDASVREDFRNSSKADTLLRELGYAHTYNGFLHMIDHTPRRSDWDGGGVQWVRQKPWVEGADGADLNPDWEAAAFEDTIVYVNNVYDCLVPGSISNLNGMKFSPQNYIGDIQWKNIIDRQDNIDGKNGFFRAVMGAAVRRRNTEFGVVIRHLRCPNDYNAQAC